nr:juvenile hormone esterase-like [Leptinotarsa decemlineata]
MGPAVVNTEGGFVRGSYRTNLNGGDFLCFLGIPYGRPPVGDLRFMAPLPAEPWTYIRDGTKEGDICFQKNSSTGKFEGSEDCLNLNVFTKELPEPSSSLKPVMVWIHGGAYRFGSNKTDSTGPEFLMIEDIVLVTINYRLGLLGFLSLRDTSLEVPGNAGLKDQAMALKWVKRNIQNFGGDPNNITIFGESAGSVSIHFHLLSQHSAGLFHKVIMQSGVVLNPAAHAEYHHIFEFIKFVTGIEVEKEKEILEIMQAMHVEERHVNQERFCEWKQYADGLIGPVIENPNETEFISEPTIDLLTSGKYNKVPIMMGYCSNEGLLVEIGRQHHRRDGTSIPKIQDNLESFIPREINMENNSTIKEYICGKLENFYFRGENAKNEFQLPSDYSFIAGIIGCAKIHAKTSHYPVYLYRMSLDAGMNFLKRKAKLTHLPGACHADDLGYLFKNTIDVDLHMGELEEIYVRRFVTLWTNFAKFGNPTPVDNNLNIIWNPVENHTLHILDIDKDLTMLIDPEAERMKIWKDIYQLSSKTSEYL